MEKDTLVLPSLSPVGDRPISVMIDNRCTSADGGVLLFQDVERRLNLANRLAACLHDPRQPGKITHPLDEILRFRMLAIVAGYPDGNDCDVLARRSRLQDGAGPATGLGAGTVLAADRLTRREPGAADGALSHG